jgi:hypothetical protein
MLIKIKGKNQERFKKTVEMVMNLACVAFGRGTIPTEFDMRDPETHGMYWYENIEERKFEILPSINNHKAFIRDCGENFIVIEFYSRYDRGGKEVNALSNLVLSLFSRDEVELR